MNEIGNQVLSREQKLALIRQYPPKQRPAWVKGPVRMRASGEILIRSHDPNPQAGDYDEGDQTLPRGILNSGDLELLTLYRDTYADTLRAMPDGALYVEYLDQRIGGITRIRQQKEESRKRLQRGELPQLPLVQELQDGTIRLTDFHQDQFQSSSQGCWSVTLSNLLKSRGVSISQEDIRAFRPETSFESGNNLKAYETNERNNDAGSDPYHDTELVMDNIPNTAVRQWGFQELPPALTDDRGNVYRDNTDDAAVAAIRQQVTYALWHDQSPIALKYCGHYQTIVGIRGNKLLIKDSLPPAAKDEQGRPIPRNPDNTYEVDLYDIVRKTRSLPEGYQKDLSLTWLSQLHRDPETGKVEELKDFPDLKVEENGKLTLTRAENPGMLTVVGPADTECGIMAAQEQKGLMPYSRTKFPNVIHRQFLKDATEPSRSVQEELTIPDAPMSRETMEGQIVARLPGYQEELDADFYLTEDAALNEAILASLETHRAEQMRIEENIRKKQANASGTQEGTQKTQGSTQTAQKSAPKAKTPGGLHLLTAKQQEYLQNPGRLEELAALFDTKKHLRIVNWNSGEYNEARNALKELKSEADTFRQYVTDHYGQPDFDQGVEQQIALLVEKENQLRTTLTTYVNKVTADSKGVVGSVGVADKTQAAGAARLSGARGLLEYLGDGTGGPAAPQAGEKKESYYGAPSEERVKDTTFESLYTRKYAELKEAGKKNVHRRAAAYAQDELQRQQKSLQAEARVK